MLMLDACLLCPLHGANAGVRHHDVLPGARREVHHAASDHCLQLGAWRIWIRHILTGQRLRNHRHCRQHLDQHHRAACAPVHVPLERNKAGIRHQPEEG